MSASTSDASSVSDGRWRAAVRLGPRALLLRGSGRSVPEMGSIDGYNTARGRRYRARYRSPDRKQRERRGFLTREEASLFLALVEVRRARGDLFDAASGAVTIGTLGPIWLSNQIQLKPSSHHSLDVSWQVFVEPEFARTPVGLVRHSDVQSWVARLSTTKSAGTVIRAHGILVGIMDVAVRDRRIAENAARGINLPKRVPKARVYLTHSQVEALALEASGHGTLIRLLAYTGLRWGEAVGLRVKNVDLNLRRIRVAENAVYVAGKIIVGTPKSHAVRGVAFPPSLAESLERLCAQKAPEMLVFGDGLNYLRPSTIRNGWLTRAVERAQLRDETFPRVTIQDLRHTAASLAISAGANVKVVQRMLGHASAAMTLDTYAGLFDDDLDTVALALDRARALSSLADRQSQPR
jgi:integrase